MRMYSGVKNCIWLQALTLLHILPREDELMYDCVKQKPLKDISASSHNRFLKINKKTLRKKASKEKQGPPVRCLCL